MMIDFEHSFIKISSIILLIISAGLACLSSDYELKIKHEKLAIDTIWNLFRENESLNSEKTLIILIRFFSSYLWEFEFFSLTLKKEKEKNWKRLVHIERKMKACSLHVTPIIKALQRNTIFLINFEFYRTEKKNVSIR